jgi:exosortase/archaeosortase family protein
MKFRLSREQERLRETFLFLVKILVFAIPLYLILTFQGVLCPLQDAVASNVCLVLGSLGLDVAREGFLISIRGENPFVFIVSEDCTGWKSMLFLVALMVAVPGVLWKKRLAGIVLGIPLIYLGNLARILLIVHVEQVYGLEIANVFHDYLWQAGLISLVLVIWVFWLVWLGRLRTGRINVFKR